MAYKKHHNYPLSGISHNTPSPCGCTGSNGELKKWYQNEKEAQNVANDNARQGVYLEPYPCPNTNGWHLKSSTNK